MIKGFSLFERIFFIISLFNIYLFFQLKNWSPEFISKDFIQNGRGYLDISKI